jgi:SAM-dependent methyltransferase
MTEWRLYPDTDIPPVSTQEFHAHRARAPHLEQAEHRARLLRAADFVLEASVAVNDYHGLASYGTDVTDLGCGDGGLLSLLQGKPGIGLTWGYDFAPANRSGWAERGVDARLLDVFASIPNPDVSLGDIAVLTEVLEHLASPHKALDWLTSVEDVDAIVASSPWGEDDQHYDECHAWAWDTAGFGELFRSRGWVLIRHEIVGGAQVVLAVRPYLEPYFRSDS